MAVRGVDCPLDDWPVCLRPDKAAGSVCVYPPPSNVPARTMALLPFFRERPFFVE